MANRLAAEAIGTFWLVFAGCGSALLSAGIPQLAVFPDRFITSNE